MKTLNYFTLKIYITILFILTIASASNSQDKPAEIKIKPEYFTKGSPVTTYDVNSPEKKLSDARLSGDKALTGNLQNEVNSKLELTTQSCEVKEVKAVKRTNEIYSTESTQTNISMIDSAELMVCTGTVTDQSPGSEGRIWSLNCIKKNNKDTFNLFYSDDNGTNWIHKASFEWSFTSAGLVLNREMDMEIVSSGFYQQKILYAVFEVNSGPGTMVGIFKINLANDNGPHIQAIFGWGQPFSQDLFTLPKITTDNSFYESVPYVYICASRRTSTSVNRTAQIVYAQDQTPFTMANITYTNSPVGVPRTHSYDFAKYDFCWFRKNNVDNVMFVEDGMYFANATCLVASQCTAWEAFSSYNLWGVSLGNNSSQIYNAAISSDGTNVMIVSEYVYSLNDKDIAYFRSSNGINGFNSILFLESSYQDDWNPEITSGWNSGGNFICAYQKNNLSTGIRSAHAATSTGLIWNFPSMMASTGNTYSVVNPYPVKTFNNECMMTFVYSNDFSKKLFSSHGCYGVITPVKKLSLKFFIEGFYDSDSNQMRTGDTVKIFLRQFTSPYNIIDSSKSFVNKQGIMNVNFANASNEVNYFIIIDHRNVIETWSSAAVKFQNDNASYDFTSEAGSAYGNNQTKVDLSPSSFAIYSGDVNNDNAVALTDVIKTYNDGNGFQTGYQNADLTGDGIVNLNDISLAYNNASKFVAEVRP